ncbi:hypothetical protein R1sor_016521 [Riccia sorocarpa]|uniref:Flavin-containing monooxygenase n=1 Tax=Riccia sorocarpa TaxID=122646 RepID=A0ABD3HF94_9MARC
MLDRLRPEFRENGEAVIGAGPAGLSLLRAFQSVEEKRAEIPELVCFEKQLECGGLWNFSEYIRVDEHGSIKIKPEQKFKLYERFVRYHTKVKSVTYSEKTLKLTVTVRDYSTFDHSEQCDHLVVCTGHFSTPNVPAFEGLKPFTGSLLHAHDLRDVTDFKGKDVLLVGSGYSAEDIACQCYKFGSKSVTITYRSFPTSCSNWPESITEVPLLELVDSNGKTCHFKDGSRKDVDVIILCTGYLHDFPFMPENLRLVTGHRMWTMGLYEGVVLETEPIVFYLGIQAQYYGFTMFDAQAWFVRDVIMGRLSLPLIDEMKAHSEKWRQAKEDALAKRDVKTFQANYWKELIGFTDCLVTPEFVDKTLKMGSDWDKHKELDIMNYRDHPFRSAVTGSFAPKHHTPWMQQCDDSLESYLK